MDFVPIGHTQVTIFRGYSYFRRMTKSGWEYFHWSGLENKWIKFKPYDSLIDEFNKVV